MTSVDVGDGLRSYVSWRSLLRSIAGAEAYLACRDEADAALGRLIEPCQALDEDEAAECFVDAWGRRRRAVADCQR